MSAEEERIHEVVATWQRAGPALEEVRRREVAALTDEDALRATCVLLEALDRLPRLPARASSGLVEQQRLLGRLRTS